MSRVIRAEQRGPRVVRRVVVEATEEAEEILRRARARAAAIVEEAARAAAHAAEGAAREAADQARERARAALEPAVTALQHACDQAYARLEPHAIDIAVLAARHIVGAELESRPAAVAAIVRPLLERLKRAHTIRLRVHPADAQWLGTVLPELQRGAGVPARLVLEPDPELSRGSCMAVSDVGALDARLETRLGILQDMLRKTRSDAE